MGSEASLIYVYQEGSDDPAVTFAQLTSRPASREANRFAWEGLKGKKVLGGVKAASADGL